SPALIGLLVPFIFLLGWMLYLKQHTGDFLAIIHSRDLWGSNAWYSVFDLFRNHDPWLVNYLYIPFSLIPGVGVFLLLRRREWWELAAVGLAMMFMFWGIGA